MFTIGVFGMIFNEKNKVLICHGRDRDLWNLPGGGMESGETPQQALWREVNEETGLEVEIIRLVGIYTKPHHDDIVFSFLCRLLGKEPVCPELNEETDAFDWCNIDTLPENFSWMQVQRICNALEDISEALLVDQREEKPEEFSRFD
ncbi:MAG: NUDIX domain-containing protein [Anaerolineales bacterium]|nr:NUDIX domain-containing protein [Anaerolineales bacterium]